MNENLQWIQTVTKEIDKTGQVAVICTRLKSSLTQILSRELIKESFGASPRVRRMAVVQKAIVTCLAVKIVRTEAPSIKVARFHT